MTRRRDNEMTRRQDDDNDSHGVKERAIARMEDGDSDRRGARHEFLGQAEPSSPFDEAPPLRL